jgi:hypothetical protein
MSRASSYWFRAKRYGWGWGLPLTWQGWASLVAYTLLLGAGMVALPATRHPVTHVAYVLTLTAGLIAICYFKGEPPKWRWGRE